MMRPVRYRAGDRGGSTTRLYDVRSYQQDQFGLTGACALSSEGMLDDRDIPENRNLVYLSEILGPYQSTERNRKP